MAKNVKAKTALRRELENNEEQSIDCKADKAAKRILQYRPLLAAIAKRVVADLRDVSIEKIEAGLGPGFPAVSHSELLTTENTEQITSNKSWLDYDLLTGLKIKSEKLDLILDMEIQNGIQNRYDFHYRMTIYAAEMAVQQMGRNIVKQRYRNFRRCISIWLVFGEKVKENKIEYQGGPQLDGKDDVGIYVVYTAGPKKPGYKGIFQMLGLIFLEEGPLQERLEILEKEYGIPVEKKFEKEVEEMCTFAAGLRKEGEKRGIKKGRKEGRKEGGDEKEKNIMFWMSRIGAWAAKTGKNINWERAGRDESYRDRLTMEAFGKTYAEAVTID